MILKEALLGSVILLLGLTFPKEARPEKAQRLEHVLVATSSRQESIHGMPYLVASRQGFFKKEGLDVEYIVMKGSIINMTLGAGRLDYTASISSPIRAAAAGLPVRLVFAIAHTRPTYIVSKKNIKTVADLKGKVIGIGSMGDSEHYGARKAIARYGLDPDKDVTFVGVGSDKPPVILSGSVDATYVSADVAILLRRRGYNLLVRASDFWPSTALGLGTQLRKIKDNPNEVKRILRGLMRGQIYTLENKEKIVDLMVKEWGVDRDYANESYDMTTSTFTKDGIMREETVEKDIELAKAMGMKLKEGITPSQIVDYTLLKEVLKELGISH